MGQEFEYDVFLSHSAKDKAVVRPLAERLRMDGLKVWFDEWVPRHGDSIPAKIQEGLKRSQFGLRISGFLRPSAFALRIWASPDQLKSTSAAAAPRPPSRLRVFVVQSPSDLA
jgi:hypothetical protein